MYLNISDALWNIVIVLTTKTVVKIESQLIITAPYFNVLIKSEYIKYEYGYMTHNFDEYEYFKNVLEYKSTRVPSTSAPGLAKTYTCITCVYYTDKSNNNGVNTKPYNIMLALIFTNRN